MATKYSDIISIRPGKHAYNIEEETYKEWDSFIPNEQFNNVLRTIIRSVRGNDIDVHKSFWINGTYGTGKSHAAAVIAHLLSDPVEDIRKWVDYEYKEAKFGVLKESIYKLRETKRLLKVCLKGLKNIVHVSHLGPLLQTSVVKALAEDGIELVVETDYDALIKNIRENEVIWNNLIARNLSLSTIASDTGMLINKLENKDAATLQKAREALTNSGFSSNLPLEDIANWLIEIQNKLRESTSYSGLLIVWDEFTEVMEDAVGLSVLKKLQAISEKFMNAENDSFIFLISHPSAFNKFDPETTKQTDGRYLRMKYNMEPVSAFKIMSRKFCITDQHQHDEKRREFYNRYGELPNALIKKSNDVQETTNDLYNLFPIHPGTANLATHYATTIGSSSRSVFEFIGGNEKMKDFLNDAEAYSNGDTITADFLWDFVLAEFNNKLEIYGAVLERYNTNKNRVENQGKAANAIFKAILLLNAFNNVAEDESVIPTEDNIYQLFKGTSYYPAIESVLIWINEEGIIPRAPGNIFSVQFSSLPSHDIAEEKKKLYDVEFRYTSQILNFGDTARIEFEKQYMQMAIRPYVFDFFSEGLNESVVKSNIKRLKKDAKTSELCLVLLYARDNRELGILKQMAEECSKAGVNDDKDLKDIVFIVADTIFGQKEYERFIEYMASYSVSKNHSFIDQAKVHSRHAEEMIKEWMQKAFRGNATIWINGADFQTALKHLTKCLNGTIAPGIYPKSPDALEALRVKAPITFWKPQVSKEIIRKFIFSNNKAELLTLNNSMKPIQHLVQDAIDDNLEWKQDVPKDHPFKAVYDYINNSLNNFISHGNTANAFDFCERFDDLTKPPYGLYNNFASEAMVAFALRKWVNKIYDTVGKPRNANNIADDIISLIKYWETRKPAKLSFKLQTPEEGKLYKELTQMFRLDKAEGYSDISSMNDARYALTQEIERRGYPLWSLKYMTEDFITSQPRLTMNDEVQKLIDNIAEISQMKDMKNVQLVTSTLQLISKYRADFPDILSKENSFKNGFDNFLMQQPDVKLQAGELDDAMLYIKQNLHSTIGYWNEYEVIDRLKDWRLRQLLPPKEPEETDNEEEDDENRNDYFIIDEQKSSIVDEPTNQGYGPASSSEQKKKARDIIHKTNDADELRDIIDKLIDLGNPEVLKIILNR